MKKPHLLAKVFLPVLLTTWLAVPVASSATITVDTAIDLLDAGTCSAVTPTLLPGPDGFISLREAICAANNNPGPDTINFAIPGGGVHTINVASALPLVTDDYTTINGYSQPGAYTNTEEGPATLLIEIDGTGINNNGLNITSSGNVIRGLAIFGFLWNEIAIGNYEGRTASYNLISGNYLGTNAGAVCPAAGDRGLNGVFIGLGAHHNTIGGEMAPNLNLISCNGYEGVGIHGLGTTDNIVSGNYIGTDPSGTTSRGNTWDGIRIYGGAQNNTVGGNTEAQRNVIAGNARDGVRLIGVGTSGNRVLGNYIGLQPDGASPLRNDWYGVYLGGGAQNNIIGGDRTAGEGNVISGNGNYGIAFVEEAVGNVVSGNRIGPAAAGTTPLPNGDTGVQMGNLAQNNTIGGSAPGRGNVISGNARNGITIEGSGNFVSGNLIGLAGDGTTSLPNGQEGIQIGPLAQNNTIGGGTPGQRNIISGNGGYGMIIDGSNNVFSGNFVGTDAGGTVARGNANDGIYLGTGAANNLIGGDVPGHGNLISGNGDEGIALEGAGNNRISGNYIGTTAAGSALLGNGGFGIYLGSGAQNNTIGGETTAAGNVISGSARDGIYIAGDTTSGNVIANNRLGTDPGGTLDLGNGQSGIELDFGTHGNIIGPGNVVAYNNYPGIIVDGAATIGNAITRNSIFANTGKGIVLTPGAHGGILPPLIAGVNRNPLTVVGTACPGCTVELFGNPSSEGQGQFYLGSAAADAGGAFTLARANMPFAYLTATATDSVKGTSEFSAVFASGVVLFTHLPIFIR